jgi:hypothetical protein
MDPLGLHRKWIEREYLERLNKVRYGLDGGWQPPGLLLRGGTDAERTAAMRRLQVLAEEDGFICSYIRLGPDLPLCDTRAICRVAVESAQFPRPSGPDADPLAELRQAAESARKSGKEGWVLLIDNLDAFTGTPVERADSYREMTRWMGALPGSQYVGLFCLFAVTPAFEQAVADPDRELASISAGFALDDADLLSAAATGIGTLRHEAIARELLDLKF